MIPFTIGADANSVAIRSSVAADLAAERLTTPAIAVDILHLAMAVYSADMYVLRSTGYDSWTRHFRLHLPVVEPDLWQNNLTLVTEMLSFLTGDHWEISLRRREQQDEQDREDAEEPEFQPSGVCLFSGGLDSYIGALELLEAKERLALVGHHGAGTANQAQLQAHRVVENHYPDRSLWLHLYVQPPMPEVGEPEKTTRSRSILFLALGTAVACSYGEPLPLYVPENGLISLNPPLTDSRMGSLSTRTTHPHFLALYRELLNALGTGVSVETPYRFTTKGEMAKNMLSNAAFTAGVDYSVSCSHPDVGRYQGASPGQHCGYCVPCIIRRAALLKAGIDDPKSYLTDIRTNPPARGSETSRDLRAFEMALARFDPDDGDRHVFEVLSTGPIPPNNIEDFVDVYRRGMLEVQDFLKPRS